MKRFLNKPNDKRFYIFFHFICIDSYAQQSIKLENVRDHVGDSVKLKALVYGDKYLQNVKGSPTFLNVGDQYPIELLTLVIWDNTRSEFKQAPEDIYDHKMVWITGKVILYKDRPEIVISNPDQIEEFIEAPAKSNRHLKNYFFFILVLPFTIDYLNHMFTTILKSLSLIKMRN